MKYRLYSFVNHLYMSPLQWGIQTAHCVSNLSVGYKNGTPQSRAYHEWASNEPTIIVCQGGNVASLRMLSATLSPLADEIKLPFTVFYEDEESLGGILTAVAVLVPETLYDVAMLPSGTIAGVYFLHENGRMITYEDKAPYELLTILKNARLA
jgi:hypothetical protein